MKLRFRWGVGGHWQECLTGSMHPVMKPPQAFGLAVASLATAKETAFLDCSVLVTENWPLLWVLFTLHTPLNFIHIISYKIALGTQFCSFITTCSNRIHRKPVTRVFSSPHFRSPSLSSARNHLPWPHSSFLIFQKFPSQSEYYTLFSFFARSLVLAI